MDDTNRTIDVTPTWAGLVAALLALVENDTKDAVDEAVAAQKRAAAIARIWVVKGVVTDPEAHGGEAPLGATEWQFSDGPPGARGSSADFLHLEDGIRAHSGCIIIMED